MKESDSAQVAQRVVGRAIGDLDVHVVLVHSPDHPCHQLRARTAPSDARYAKPSSQAVECPAQLRPPGPPLHPRHRDRRRGRSHGDPFEHQPDRHLAECALRDRACLDARRTCASAESQERLLGERAVRVFASRRLRRDSAGPHRSRLPQRTPGLDTDTTRLVRPQPDTRRSAAAPSGGTRPLRDRRYVRDAQPGPRWSNPPTHASSGVRPCVGRGTQSIEAAKANRGRPQPDA
jgi:hypothetical protein